MNLLPFHLHFSDNVYVVTAENQRNFELTDHHKSVLENLDQKLL